MITESTLRTLLDGDAAPCAMPDVLLLREYLHRGLPYGDPICLSFGETWDRVPPALAARLAETPVNAHGYQLSLYGLPRLRSALREHLATGHGLAGGDWEVAVSWTGTRHSMFDFGRLVKERTGSSTPVVLAAGPSWDYSGVFGPLGFAVRYLPLRPEHGFQPQQEDLAEAVAKVLATPGEHLAMVVINAQHNPTAVNWSEGFVTAMVDAAVEHDAAILVDDAYFGVCDAGVTATSALRVVVERAPRVPWLAVRSMGKQFGCNGWGIGSMVAAPDVLSELVNRYRLHHGLMHAGPAQHAMADWLESAESADFLTAQSFEVADIREAAVQACVEQLGHPRSAVHAGECTPYVLIEVPPAYEPEQYRAECFERTGVLVAPVWPWPYPGPESGATPLPYLRLYIAAGEKDVVEATRRMADAGLTYR
ncbi:pyridoxal phosphate-dependent aminotransferase [Allokutzneria sp. A3M-2-11 16]|uniref:pyridoxal phosphate-dependent aminotransferase n=1 Tax=Allokutzneria sp. A3M-2-11 16 TaxID=2962043 RepID=UPI0020B702A6|nr:pyridoxal phosphate-dependent aminotransferase [Allokutzneria sp. A3M-2-11 16]MCP3802714.1 pyridoxal phosphate-dependent aminotransferase [Allokutzneria sp. A3M-2-11 16]